MVFQGGSQSPHQAIAIEVTPETQTDYNVHGVGGSVIRQHVVLKRREGPGCDHRLGFPVLTWVLPVTYH
jgi:hypothetical protein